MCLCVCVCVYTSAYSYSTTAAASAAIKHDIALVIRTGCPFLSLCMFSPFWLLFPLSHYLIKVSFDFCKVSQSQHLSLSLNSTSDLLTGLSGALAAGCLSAWLSCPSVDTHLVCVTQTHTHTTVLVSVHFLTMSLIFSWMGGGLRD